MLVVCKKFTKLISFFFFFNPCKQIWVMTIEEGLGEMTGKMEKKLVKTRFVVLLLHTGNIFSHKHILHRVQFLYGIDANIFCSSVKMTNDLVECLSLIPFGVAPFHSNKKSIFFCFFVKQIALFFHLNIILSAGF